MMNSRIVQNFWFIFASGIGGYLLSLTGMPIGWMIGTLVAAALFSFKQPVWITWNKSKKGILPSWRYVGQAIIGITLGKEINGDVLQTFENHWQVIVLMLFISIGLALLSGILLWRFSQTDMITSLFATTPGGISAMPSIAEEVGANTAVVSIVQMIRIFLVSGLVPLIASKWAKPVALPSVSSTEHTSSIPVELNIHTLSWTAALVIGCSFGYWLGKKIKLPAPWLVGGMMGTAVVQMIGSKMIDPSLTAFWPQSIIVLAQILIGASIGSKLNASMFAGAKQMVMVGLLTSAALILTMTVCAIGVSQLIGIPVITAMLAFAPGGVAEMATASVALNADSSFVVAVQVLRLISIFILLPTFFRLLSRQTSRDMQNTM